MNKLEQLVAKLEAIKADAARAQKALDLQCLAVSKEKFGVFVGAEVVHRFGEKGQVCMIIPTTQDRLPHVKVRRYKKNGELGKAESWFCSYTVCKVEDLK